MTAIALVATTLAASGCGGSSKSLTRAELIAKGDQICRRINAKIVYFSNLTPANKQDLLNPQAITNAAGQISSTELSARAELDRLTPPSELAGDWKQILANVKTLAEDTAKIGEYAKTKNATGAPGVFSSAQSVRQQLQATAKRDGFADCSKLV